MASKSKRTNRVGDLVEELTRLEASRRRRDEEHERRCQAYREASDGMTAERERILQALGEHAAAQGIAPDRVFRLAGHYFMLRRMAGGYLAECRTGPPELDAQGTIMEEVEKGPAAEAAGDGDTDG